MASNRVERLQMRQRGAGTRKIKEVDFGFSLGFGPPADESSQPASQPINSQPDTVPASQPLSLGVPPPAQDTTATTPPQTQSLLSPTRINANAAAHNQTIQRTPGSARNKLPPRPSTFDIPDENEPELERSSKRRRVESPGDVSPLIDAQPAPTKNNVTEQPTIEESTSPPQYQGVAIPIRTHSSNAPPNEEQPEPPSIPTNEADGQPAEAPEVAGTLEVETTEQPASEPTRVNSTVSPPSDTSAGKRRGRKKRSPPSPSQNDILSDERREEEPTEAQPTKIAPPEKPVEAPQEQEPVEVEPPEAGGKRTRSRTPASVQPPDSLPADETQNDNATSDAVPTVTTAKGTRGRKKKDSTRTEKAVTTEVNNVAADGVQEEATVNGITKREAPDQAMEETNEADNGKKRAGRPKKQISQPPEEPEEPSVSKRKRQREEQEERPAEAPAAPSQSKTETSRAGKRRKQRAEEEPARQEEVAQPRAGRGRKRGERRPSPHAEGEPEAEAGPSRAGKEAQAEQEKSARVQEKLPESEPEVAQSRAGRGRKRGERKPSLPDEHEPEPEEQASRAGKEAQDTQEVSAREHERAEPDPQVEQPRAKEWKKRRAERKQPSKEQPEEPEEQPDREAAMEPQPQPEREQAKAKRGRGRRPAAETEEPAQGDTTQAQPRAPKRKREPRGETVPITVHRLANAASLGGEILESASEDERESPDETSSKQTTKLPSRGGVNAADVLAQICRETLEKTITTLKNGIANENNTAKRAEWSLRRKAVEAFGSELEGRLFDLSETLDSNFILSAKVKKAKRNMMDLRARLDRVRREREAVALKMDAVRREHTKEEQAGLARSTINHSLHNLDLALERSQGRSTEDERLTAGLEFRLRNTARNVSSTAPGAQGGLLSQIKAFNAQLERQLAP